MSSPIRVAVDAMGGDRAPDVVVRGALQALEAFPDLHVRLVGRPDAVQSHLGGRAPDRLQLVPAEEVIGMDESPARALRQKPKASIAICAGLLKEKQVEAVVSAGNTGAVIAAAMFAARLLPGVHRPGIAASFPTARGPVVLCDVGANIQCKPVHYQQYAVMASAYSQQILGVATPRVGLLSIGQEETKGSAELREARAALEALAAKGAIHFIGSVEGNHVFEGEADVVVCDGFIGNVILKAAEGVGRAIIEQFVRASREAAQDLESGSESEQRWLKAGLQRLERITDYSEYGGAPLLGIDGCAIIAHGRSDERAIWNAVRVAREFSRQDLNSTISARLAAAAGDAA